MRFLLYALLLIISQAGAVAAQAHLLIIGGLGGEPRYVEDFYRWGSSLVDAAQERYGVPDENIVFLSEDPARDATRISGESRRDDIATAIREIASRAGPDDRVMIVLFGHGSSDSRGTRINLPGPDLTDEELAEMLLPLGERPTVIVHTGSASGGFQEALAAPSRLVITATRSGQERNETIFGGYFVDAFSSDGADTNRDGRVTVAEATEYATRETQRAYETDGRLQLEHARVEGNLELAGSFHLGSRNAAAPADAPAGVQALHNERQRLEESIDALRVRSSQMDPAEYQRELELLLLELARTNRAIEEEGDSR